MLFKRSPRQLRNAIQGYGMSDPLRQWAADRGLQLTDTPGLQDSTLKLCPECGGTARVPAKREALGTKKCPKCAHTTHPGRTL